MSSGSQPSKQEETISLALGPDGLPVKTVEVQHSLFDSTRWNGFPIREGDIIIATYAKAGTTWMQQLVGQLVLGPDPTINSQVPQAQVLSPWLDFRLAPKEAVWDALEKQTHRRFIKTHLRLEAMVFSPKAKYLYLVRDGRDVAFSFYHHTKNMTPAAVSLINDTPGRFGPPLEVASDFLTFWDRWMKRDGYPYWPFFSHIKSWWAVRHLPNVHFIHFADLKKDPKGTTERMTAFLGVTIPEDKWPKILEYSSFAFMQAHPELCEPGGGFFFAGRFIRKGESGGWRELLSKEQNEEYEAKSRQELGEELAAWVNRC